MFRRPIEKLAPSLVNRIAAGEVIERPASVVKELVENSLDAGAENITVTVEDGGRAMVRVSDDGGGIPASELSLAFAPHATSKLSCDEDLFRISTMGFRGEALASIGAVSHAKITSRMAGQEAAFELRNDGGLIGQVTAAAGNPGTVIEVRDLFFNTPARRKFLRGTATEFGQVSDTLLKLALPFPQVSFRLIHNGRTSMDLPASSPEDRLLAAWPEEFHEMRMPVDLTAGEIRLNGIIGLPELARPTQKYQFVYLNGRAIRDRFITHALREAYRGLTEPGRHPAAILMLTMPPGDVDVNVHPTKSEVRFRDGGRIHSIIHSTAREKLVIGDLAPTAVPGTNDVQDRQRQHLRERLAAFFKQEMPVERAPGFPEISAPAIAASPGLSFAPVERFAPADAAPSMAPATANIEMEPMPVFASATVDGRPRRGAIQLHKSYLVAESDDGMVIIDQHALHERILYEDLKGRLARGPLESQQFLMPAVVSASSGQIELLQQIQPLMRKLGIVAEPFGPDSVAVQAFPSFLGRLDPGQFMEELLERGEQELLDLTEEELLHEILDMMACKAAVKAGDALTDAEINALLARRHLVERSSNCPHGRPTTLRLTLKDLEKQFKRTGF